MPKPLLKVVGRQEKKCCQIPWQMAQHIFHTFLTCLPRFFGCRESSHKHLFFSMTSSIGLIVTRSQKPSSCLCVCVCESLSPVWLFATPRTVAHQTSLSMEFSRQEYWSGLPFPSPEDLPSPGIEPWSPADSLPFELQGSPPAVWFLPYILIINIITKRLHLWAPICILMHQKNIFL